MTIARSFWPSSARIVVLTALLASAARSEPPPPPPDTTALRQHIRRAWSDLTRSNEHLLQAAVDPKLELPPGEPWPVYVSRREDRAAVARTLEAALGEERWRQIDLRVLPGDRSRIDPHGLLYLPRPYVVPGGRFNEMYGWDSF